MNEIMAASRAGKSKSRAVKHPFAFEQFREIYSKVPRVSVDLVIQTPNGIVLTLRKLPSWNGLWHLPGVTVLYKEPVERAVRRCAREEAGAAVTVEKLLGYLEYPSEEQQRGFGSTVSLVFLCKATNTVLRANREAAKIKAFSELSKLPVNIIDEHRPILEKLLSGQEWMS
jgi:ADP-ribose pyrophosphatase YjhB (NUDIX family)